MAITDGIFEELMPATASRLKQQQATIDALVAALEDCVEKMGNSAPVHNDYWDAVESAEDALALARGEGVGSGGE